ncbi:MATE family efflux transporter [Maridesulfovibrio bastinii]|uniref:MATE family efflux transporter n=1 Tax=Maridesulfovibrio bastinii TaxID=47157 RepID=UPI0003FF1977|nr:MATE family efflux transporter [Maridesulfovibrio bastinii]
MFSKWSAPFGYKDVLKISLPLAASMASTTIMQFTDRIFLGNYSVEAIAAVLPAGILSFLFISFFMGVSSYVNVFIAQYTGSGRYSKVGSSLWQGIYFSLIAWFIMFLLAFAADPLFAMADHPKEIQDLEKVYYTILMFGAGLPVFDSTLSGFYSGRGLTRTVMVVNFIGALVNIPLDYVLINGLWGFPEMGIKGAAIATVTASAVIVGLYLKLIFSDENEKMYSVRSAWKPDLELFRRFVRYGLTNGVQFFVDIFAVTYFVYVLGRLGKIVLAASNIVLSIDGLSFFPAYGISIGVSSLVGQALGQNRPEMARRATICAFHITLVWMLLMGIIYVCFPDTLIGFFRPNDVSDSEFGAVLEHGRIYMVFMACYVLMDGIVLTFAGALKGAGDVFYVLKAVTVGGLLALVLPCHLGANYLDFNSTELWAVFTAYIFVLGIFFVLRFRGGKWESMRVID